MGMGRVIATVRRWSHRALCTRKQDRSAVRMAQRRNDTRSRVLSVPSTGIYTGKVKVKPTDTDTGTDTGKVTV